MLCACVCVCMYMCVCVYLSNKTREGLRRGGKEILKGVGNKIMEFIKEDRKRPVWGRRETGWWGRLHEGKSVL